MNEAKFEECIFYLKKSAQNKLMLHGGACMAGGVGGGGMHGGGRGVAGKTATEVGGTHPSGMHSCFSIRSKLKI